MRIVAHNGAQIFGGAERATLALLDGLKSRGHSVTLLCNSDLVARNAEAHGIDTELCVIGGDVMIHHAVRLAMTLRRLQPDVFIVGTFKKLFLAGLGARIARVRRVVARVGLETDTPRSTKYRYALLHWIDAVAVNSNRMTTPFVSLDGFGAEKVSVIWNGIRPPEDDSPGSSLRSELGIPEGAFVVGTVGRLAKQKRIDRLIRAVAMMPGVSCIIAGDGSRKPELISLIHELGVGDRVHLIGHRSDPVEVLRALDVFVVSSDTEGLSNAMLEAMASGLPTVSTPVSGAEDALLPAGRDAAGIVVDFTPESISAAVSSLRDDSDKRSRMSSSAIEVASTLFSMDTMLDKWEVFLAK